MIGAPRWIVECLIERLSIKLYERVFRAVGVASAVVVSGQAKNER